MESLLGFAIIFFTLSGITFAFISALGNSDSNKKLSVTAFVLNTLVFSYPLFSLGFEFIVRLSM